MNLKLYETITRFSCCFPFICHCSCTNAEFHFKKSVHIYIDVCTNLGVVAFLFYFSVCVSVTYVSVLLGIHIGWFL